MLESFRETVINILRFDEDYKGSRGRLISMLSRSQIYNVHQYEFVRGSGRKSQHYEEIEIRVLTLLLPETKTIMNLA